MHKKTQFLLPAAWDHPECMRAEEKLKCFFFGQLDVTDNRPILVQANLCPTKSPYDNPAAEGGAGLHEKSTFL